jgi:DNA polymerase-3 subunit delta
MVGDSVKPIYVLAGKDAFLRDQHRNQLIETLTEGADPQTCLAVYDASVELSTVLDELRTLPFLAPRRVVILTDADTFLNADTRDALEKYLESPAPTGVLILLASSWKSNTRLHKAVVKVGEIRSCEEVKGNQAMGQVLQFAQDRGKQLHRNAAGLLVQWIGADLASLNNEVEKLALYVGDRKQITVEDVSTIVTASAGPGAFDLTNAIADGKTDKALEALGGLLSVRGEEFRTLGLIGWHLRMALRAAELVAKGRSPDDACRAAKIPPFRKRDYVNLLRRRSAEKLRADFRRLIAADLALKSGASAPAAMQDLVIALCN